MATSAPPPEARRFFVTFVGNVRNAPERGDQRPALASLRLKELVGVTRVALLYDAADAVSAGHAEALAHDLGRLHKGIQPRKWPLTLAAPGDAHATRSVEAAVRAAVTAMAQEEVRRLGETEFVVSVATGTSALWAAALDALDGLGARVSVLYDAAEGALSVWRGPARAVSAEPALSLLGAAPAVWNVLLEGPTGAGKTHAAQRLHDAWAKTFLRKGRFVAINAAATSRELLASELFGHAKGSFTGAGKPREGAFRSAHEGTLFLDEIGDLPLELQSHLLTVLDVEPRTRTRLVRPLGDDDAKPVEVRLITGTNRDLLAMARAGTFRLDLLGRLSTHRVALPALAEARHRIVSAYHHHLEALEGHYPSVQGEHARFSFEQAARQRLMAHVFAATSAWPWNHRDVMQSAERLAMRAWAARGGGKRSSEQRPAVVITQAHVEAELAELTARWSALVDAPGAEREAWATVEAQVLPGEWVGLSQVERWELRFLLEAKEATTTNADAWRYIAARNLLEGASDPRSLHNASNAFDKRWRRYAEKLRAAGR
jgi:transcriptional regulator with AAA-type ATPase domain